MAQYGKVNYDFQCELSQNFRKMLYEGNIIFPHLTK